MQHFKTGNTVPSMQMLGIFFYGVIISFTSTITTPAPSRSPLDPRPTTNYYVPRTRYHGPGTMDHGLPTTDYGLRTTDHRPRTTDYGLWTTDHRQHLFRLRQPHIQHPNMRHFGEFVQLNAAVFRL